MPSDNESVQRELGSLGAKIYGLGAEIRYRFDDLAKTIETVKRDADHDIRNANAKIDAVNQRVDRKVIEEPQWTAHLSDHGRLIGEIDNLKSWRNRMIGALAVISTVGMIVGGGISAWVGSIPHDPPKAVGGQAGK